MRRSDLPFSFFLFFSKTLTSRCWECKTSWPHWKHLTKQKTKGLFIAVVRQRQILSVIGQPRTGVIRKQKLKTCHRGDIMGYGSRTKGSARGMARACSGLKLCRSTTKHADVHQIVKEHRCLSFSTILLLLPSPSHFFKTFNNIQVSGLRNKKLFPSPRRRGGEEERGARVTQVAAGDSEALLSLLHLAQEVHSLNRKEVKSLAPHPTPPSTRLSHPHYDSIWVPRTGGWSPVPHEASLHLSWIFSGGAPDPLNLCS